MILPQPPFKLLTEYCARNSLKACAFLLPDGRQLDGLPAASFELAVHNIFESDEGRPLAKPYADHFVPLADATLQLCGVFMYLLRYEAELHGLLTGCLAHKHPLPEDETIEAVYALINQLQAVVDYAHKITALIAEHAADPLAKAMREHPLTSYSEITAVAVMCWCKLVTSALGMSDTITLLKPEGTPDKKPAGIANMDLASEEVIAGFVTGWPADQTAIWWNDRDARMRHYVKWFKQLMAPTIGKADLAEQAKKMMFGAAVLH